MSPPKSTILIVDDDPAGRRAMEAPLLNDDYELVLAQDGVQALQLARSSQPDLILLDVMMPNMDGFEVCRRLRADPQLAEVPIVMVTALDDRASKLQGLAAGADDFLAKPFDRAELRARVQTITRLNRYRRLQAERLQFRWIIDTTDEGYILLDAQDQILYLNQPAARFLNVENQEQLDEPFRQVAQRHYRCEPAAGWAQWPTADAGGEHNRHLVRPASSQAPARWLNIQVLAVPPGAGAAYLVRLRDVTRQFNEYRDIASFRLAIRHKLRTPVAHMAMSATLLTLTGPPEGLPPLAAEYANVVQNAAQQLGQHIDDLLAYSNPVPGDEAPDVALATLEASLHQVMREHGVKHYQWYATTPADERSLPLSPQAINIILHELVGNACKFHPAHAPCMAVTLKEAGPNQVMLQVEDDGLTLGAEQIEQIWKPFYQAEASFSGNMPGMGLGLTLIAALVIGAGGHVHFYNRSPGPGVAVELTLPLQHPF
jgi:CheY-like chemotaxis protein/nitrogen-specific signal transduction histidine kinase